MTPEYVEIARARIEFAKKQGYQPDYWRPHECCLLVRQQLSSSSWSVIGERCRF
jgi:hypothetical protein